MSVRVGYANVFRRDLKWFIVIFFGKFDVKCVIIIWIDIDVWFFFVVKFGDFLNDGGGDVLVFRVRFVRRVS